MSSKFFLLLFYVNESTVKTQLVYYCYGSFFTKHFESGRLEFDILGFLVLAIWRRTYGERQLITKRPNVKRDVIKHNSNSNGKQEANNKEFKVFCVSCDLEIISRKNDKSSNKGFRVMILTA